MSVNCLYDEKSAVSTVLWVVVVVSGIAPYVDNILHGKRFWDKSTASGIVRWCCYRSCCTMLSHVMRGRSGRLLKSAGEANCGSLSSRLLTASARHAVGRWPLIGLIVIVAQLFQCHQSYGPDFIRHLTTNHCFYRSIVMKHLVPYCLLQHFNSVLIFSWCCHC